MRLVIALVVVVSSGCHPREPAEPLSDRAPPDRAEPTASSPRNQSPPAAGDSRPPEGAEADREGTGGQFGTLNDQMAGGFGYGRTGFGPGGAATGWGIGTSAIPTARAGQPIAAGGLARAVIQRQILRNMAKITYCYEKALLARPQLSGTVTAHFFIAPSGLVARADATGVDPVVARCVAAMIKGIAFPKPRGGGVQVTYPFTFAPAPAAAPAAPRP